MESQTRDLGMNSHSFLLTVKMVHFTMNKTEHAVQSCAARKTNMIAMHAYAKHCK